MKKKQLRKRTRIIRLAVQLFFLGLVILVSINHYRAENNLEPLLIGSPSLHAVCPFGGVETLYTLISSGKFVKQTHQSSVVLMVLVFLIAVLVGPAFCGWICPFGTIQDLVGKLGKKIFKYRYNTFIPEKIHKILRNLRYLVLAGVVINTSIAGTLVFTNIDPYYALFNIWSAEVAVSAFIVLGLVLVGSLFVSRPWCKYLCPYGAILGLFNAIKIFQLKRNSTTCINCKQCDKACPMNIDVSGKSKIIDPQCIVCGECTDEVTCPVDSTLGFYGGYKNIKIMEKQEN